MTPHHETPSDAESLAMPKQGLFARHGETVLRVLIPLRWSRLWCWSGMSASPSPRCRNISCPVRWPWQRHYTDWGILGPALWVTTKITLMSLALALIGGVGIAVFLIQSKWIETAFYPIAVILQVTPVVAISPLILIYAPSTQVALLICAFLVAFFPILSNMVQGLKSVDHNLLNLFDLYGASRLQTLLYLKLPASLPYFMTGLKIGGGLALIAAVVAEFAAGSAGAGSGLAFRLLESQFRLNIPRLFAALFLLSCLGVVIFAITSFISWLALHRWHESSIKREN